jgi:hypothetical protein
MLPDNTGMLRIAANLGFTVRRAPDGVESTAELVLDQ